MLLYQHMKINQLFTRNIEIDVLLQVLNCFGLKDLQDHRTFSKADMVLAKTVQKLACVNPSLNTFYMPCKAKLYLQDMNEKKAVTVLKQCLRLHSYKLRSREKNIGGKKIVLYSLVDTAKLEGCTKLQVIDAVSTLTF